MPLTRQCPQCGEILLYANVPGFQRARRLNMRLSKQIDEVERFSEQGR